MRIHFVDRRPHHHISRLALEKQKIQIAREKQKRQKAKNDARRKGLLQYFVFLIRDWIDYHI